MSKEKDGEKFSNPLVYLLKEEWKFLGDKRPIFIFYLFLFVIASVITLLTPLVIGMIFNSIQQNGITSLAELKSLMWMISLLFFITVGFWVFHGTARVLERLTAFQVHRNYMNSKIQRVLDLPTKWHKNHHSGDTIDKVNRARDAISSFSSEMTFQTLYAVLEIFGSLIILFFVNWKIASFALAYSFITLFIMMRLDRILIRKYKKINFYSNKLSSAVFDYLGNILTVITLRLKKRVRKEIDSRIVASYRTEKESIILNEIKWSFSSLAISVMVVAALLYETYTSYISEGTILIGTLYILYGYLNNVGRTFRDFGNIYGSMTRKSARVQGVAPIDEAYSLLAEKNYGKINEFWKSLEIKNLNFSYHDGEVDTHLDNVSLNIKRGQKIALIGESGSGKSTLLSLLRGLYRPDKGILYIDGKEEEHGFSKLHKHVTLIPQDPELFNNSVEYNITLGIPTKKEEIMRVIKMAQFEGVLRKLPNGLKTNVLERGVSLSGGEKQRLALARGLLAASKSDIVLLDEPTSSVDSLNEIAIHDNISTVYKDKTIISSIHRLHLLEKFDYIYMFDKGKIVGEGTLPEMKQNKTFMDILRRQELQQKKK